MKKITLTLMTLLCFPCINASTSPTDIAVSYDTGSFLSNFNCSGSFIRNNNKRYFVSASHCFKNSPNYKINTYIYDAKKHRRVRKSKVNINLKEEYYFNRKGDTLFKEIPTSTKIKTQELELSSTRAVLGDRITALGYPIVRGKRVATKLNCMFLGSTVYTTGVIPVSIGRIIRCETNLKSVGGISGGPILNESGDFLGTASAEVQPVKNHNFRGNRFIYLVFNEVTNELLEEHKMKREITTFIKMIPGTYYYKKADPKVFVNPALYEI